MKKVFIVAILVVAFTILYQRRYTLSPIRYWDEHYWVAKSVQLDMSFHNKDPLWDVFESYDQPPVVGYVDYFFLKKTFNTHSLPNESFSDFLYRHNFSTYNRKSVPIFWEGNVNGKSRKDLILEFGKGIEKTIAIIMVVRKYNAILLALLIGLIFIISDKFSHNSGVAFVTAMLFGINNKIIELLLIAHSDTLFITLFYVIIFLFYKIRTKKNLLWVCLLSLLSALLFQTKINGIMIFGFIFVYFLWQKQWIKSFIYFELFLLFSILVNPTLMHWDFVIRMYRYFELRHITEIDQIKAFPHAYMSNVGQTLYMFFDHYFFRNGPRYFNVILYSRWEYFTLLVFCLIGMVKQWEKQRIIVIFFAWIFAVTAMYLRLDADRYWIHLSFFIYYFEVYGMVVALSYYFKWIQRNKYSLLKR